MGKGPKKGKASSLMAHHFLPQLSKPAHVIGEFIAMQGKEWSGCPAADKEKWYTLAVRKFEAVHDFGAFKQSAFEVQEMGSHKMVRGRDFVFGGQWAFV